jgi:hypothetical protein
MAQAGIGDGVMVRINRVSPLDLTTSRCIRAGPSKTINRRLHFAPSSIACSYTTLQLTFYLFLSETTMLLFGLAVQCAQLSTNHNRRSRDQWHQWGQKRDNGALKPGCMARIVASVMSLSRGTDCLSLRNVEDIIDLVSRNF